MSLPFLGFALLALGLMGLLAFLLLAPLGRPLDRDRVSRFAERHALPITPGNGPLVVRALGTTHRWRRFGLVAGLILALLWAVRDGRLSVDFVAMFLGWFAGAVVAEWRISTPVASGTRRQADLRARSVASYLTAPNRVTLAVVLALLAATGAVAGAFDLPDPGRRTAWLASAAGCLLGAGVLVAVTRRIVDRPRPAGPSDVRDADDALRAHSLTVIAGSAVALASLPLADFCTTIAGRLIGPEEGAVTGFLVLVAGLVAGWFVAARSASVRRTAPVAAGS